MIVNLYLKGGQKVVLKDIDELTTNRDTADDKLTSLNLIYGNPNNDKVERFHSCLLSEIALITTEDR